MIYDFVAISLIGLFLLFITTLIHYEILRNVWNLLPKLQFKPRLWVLVFTVAAFAAHIISIWIYAAAYFLIENYTALGVLSTTSHEDMQVYDEFLNSLYFSAATYSSLGLGDVFPTGHLRMIAGAEVLNGLCMIGWTVTFTYLSMEKFWELPHKEFKKKR